MAHVNRQKNFTLTVIGKCFAVGIHGTGDNVVYNDAREVGRIEEHSPPPSPALWRFPIHDSIEMSKKIVER